MKRFTIPQLLILLSLTSKTFGFVVVRKSHTTIIASSGPAVRWGSQSYSHSVSLANSNNDNNNETNNNPLPFDFRKFRGPLIIGLLAIQAVVNLFTRDLPPILKGQPDADYFGAILDTVFFGWAGTTLMLQTGILADSIDDDDENAISLEGLECQVLVDVGREPGTWMDKEWAVSGGRLVLPITVRFTNEKVDLGIPGEEGLGGRYCRKLEVLDDDEISFVSPQGTVTVPVINGGWATLPILDQKLESGERKLRFFLDFPNGAQRNDVSIPPGRVFFSSAVLPREAASSNAKAILAPDGSGILPEGGVTIKSNGNIFNLWGAAGDINLILGKYSVRAATTAR